MKSSLANWLVAFGVGVAVAAVVDVVVATYAPGWPRESLWLGISFGVMSMILERRRDHASWPVAIVTGLIMGAFFGVGMTWWHREF